MVSSRTADHPHGPCHVLAPLSSTETDEGKGLRGGGTSSTTPRGDRSLLLPSRSSSASKKSPAGGRPAPLSEVAGWQERVQRHCVEHLAEVCPVVQILDADVPVPLLVEQYAVIWIMEEDILAAADHLDRDFQVPELVIEVPKISLDVIPLRTLVPEPQMAEQLVADSTSTNQFLVVEDQVLVFKVLSQDRVQQRRLPLRNALLSGLWGRSLIFLL